MVSGSVGRAYQRGHAFRQGSHAFQFKKSKRAVLVGSTTAGAFTGGSNAFRAGFVLFYPYNGPILLDDQRLEGVGVAPDVRVDDPVERPGKGDPQLERGIEEMRTLLDRY